MENAEGIEYWGGDAREWLDCEIGFCKTPEEAAREYASMQGLQLGDRFCVCSGAEKNPDYDPDWGTSEENPQFFFTGPVLEFEITVQSVPSA